MVSGDFGPESFWGGDRVERLHPRLVAELLVDSEEFHKEPGVLMKYLRDQGYAPDFVRAKGYISHPHVVAVLPLIGKDLTHVAGVGVRRNLFDPEEEATATGTIVKMAGAVNAVEFRLLTVVGENVDTRGPIEFEELKLRGCDGVIARLVPSERDRDRIRMERLTRGRAIAAAAIEDLAREELAIGFISQSEFHQLVKDAEFYADVARLHSYLSAVSAANGGCTGCTSTSSYICTSTSCNITIGLSAEMRRA